MIDESSYCSCNTCSGRIEFDASLFQTGSVVVCPHCGIETALYIQKNNLSPVSLVPEKLIQIPLQEQLQRIDSLVIIGGTDCPSCNSSQTQRMEMAFTMGISKKQGSIVGIDLQGDVGVGSYGGTSQTALSVAVSPPQKRSVLIIYLVVFLLTWIISGLSAGLLILAFGEHTWIIVAEIICFVGCMFLVSKFAGKRRKYNTQIYPQLARRWLAAWICLRCGKKWIPEK